MADALPIAEAQVLLLFLASLAYGVYLVTLALCVRTFAAGARARGRWLLVAATALMVVCITMSVGIWVREHLRAFVWYTGPGGPEQAFAEVSTATVVLSTVNFQIVELIGDGILIHRCYVVFLRRSLVVLCPLLLWLANVTLSVVIVYLEATANIFGNGNRLQVLEIAGLCLTLTTNLLTTGLIMWRLWSVYRETSKLLSMPSRRRSGLYHVMRIIAESGLLYTVFVMMAFGTEIAGTNASYVIQDVMLVVIGISFNLIIIRVDEKRRERETAEPPTQSALSFVVNIPSQPGASWRTSGTIVSRGERGAQGVP